MAYQLIPKTSSSSQCYEGGPYNCLVSTTDTILDRWNRLSRHRSLGTSGVFLYKKVCNMAAMAWGKCTHCCYSFPGDSINQGDLIAEIVH